MLVTKLKPTRFPRNKGNAKSTPVRYRFDNSEYDHLYKVKIMGDSGVGKSSLIKRFCDDSFTKSSIVTLGVAFKYRTLQVDTEGEPKRVRMQIWDSQKQQQFRQIQNSGTYRGANVFIFVCDVTDRESFNHLQSWLLEAERHASSEAVKIIVGNKVDLKSDRVVSDEEIKKFADQNGCFATTASAATPYNVDDVFEFAAKECLARQLNKENQKENKEIQPKQASKTSSDTSSLCKTVNLEEEWLNSEKHKREVQNFETIWNNPKYNTHAKKIAAVLNDYAMNDSFLARVFTGHWRRHHCYDVNLIAKSIEHNLVKNPDNIESVLKKLDRITLHNNYGTLATLKYFLAEKQNDSPQNRELFEP